MEVFNGSQSFKQLTGRPTPLFSYGFSYGAVLTVLQETLTLQFACSSKVSPCHMQLLARSFSCGTV